MSRRPGNPVNPHWRRHTSSPAPRVGKHGGLPMAKALVGHVGGYDPRLVFEMRRLRQRVRDLETEVMQLREENDALASSVTDAHLISLEVAKESVLA